MKISPPSGPSPAERRRVESKRDSAGFATLFGDQPGAGQVGASVPLASLGSVLSVQEVEPREGDVRNRAIEHGHALLDELQGFHLDMIEGWMTETELRRLADLVAEKRPEADDPKLTSVLDDIETRAAVELAKLRR